MSGSISATAPVFVPQQSRRPDSVFEVSRSEAAPTRVPQRLAQSITAPNDAVVTHLYREPIAGRGTTAPSSAVANAARCFSTVMSRAPATNQRDDVEIDTTRRGNLHRLRDEADQGIALQKLHERFRSGSWIYNAGLRTALQRAPIDILVDTELPAGSEYKLPEGAEPHRLKVNIPAQPDLAKAFLQALAPVASSEQRRDLDRRAYDGRFKSMANGITSETELSRLQQLGQGEVAAGLYADQAIRIAHDEERWCANVLDINPPPEKSVDATEMVDRYRELRGRVGRRGSIAEPDPVVTELQHLPIDTPTQRQHAKLRIREVFSNPVSNAPQRHAALQRDIARREREDDDSVLRLVTTRLTNFAWKQIQGMDYVCPADKAIRRADLCSANDPASQDLTRAVVAELFPDHRFPNETG